MPTAPRKPLLVNLAWAAALVFVLTAGYVLSYAPVYRWKNGKSPQTLASSDTLPSFLPRSLNRWRPSSFYRTVDVLIDMTPLREPLLRWAGLFGVRADFEAGCRMRSLNRDTIMRN